MDKQAVTVEQMEDKGVLLSNVILQLQAIQTEHGDLPVYGNSYDGDLYCGYASPEIQVIAERKRPVAYRNVMIHEPKLVLIVA